MIHRTGVTSHHCVVKGNLSTGHLKTYKRGHEVKTVKKSTKMEMGLN